MTTRISKIARLPREIREQLNRRLEDGELGKTLVRWLNSLPGVRAVIRAEFGGRLIIDQNVSDWRGAGYRDWLAKQEVVEHVQRLVAEAREVGQAAQTPLTDQLGTWLAGLYTVAVRRWAAGDGNGAGDCAVLRDLCQDVVALRRADQSAARLVLERERVDLEKAASQQNREAEFLVWLKRPEVMEAIRKRSWVNDPEAIQGVMTKLFGPAPQKQQIPEGQFCTLPAGGGEPPAGSAGQPSPLKANKG